MVRSQKVAAETLVYVIAHEGLGWRKIGVGFGSRLERWRRGGWTLEQQVLCPTREEALALEDAVKTQLRKMDLTITERALPEEGSTEVWPFEWGTIDLDTLAKAVRDFRATIDRATKDLLLAWLAEGTVILYESPHVSREDKLELRQSAQELLETVRDALRQQFVTEEHPEATRDDLESWGYDWDTTVKARQAHWQTKHSGPPTSSSDPGP